VAFSEGTTIVDSNGEVTEMNGKHGNKDSADSHTKSGAQRGNHHTSFQSS